MCVGKDFFKKCLRKIPVFGLLLEAEAKAFRSAWEDISIAVIFSTFPMWFYPTLVSAAYNQPFWKTVYSFMNSGEFFLYAAALIGPLIYSTTKKYSDDVKTEDNAGEPGEQLNRFKRFPLIKTIHFPYGRFFIFSALLVCLFSSVFFGIMRLDVLNSNSVLVQKGFLFTISVIFYCFTLLSYFCVSVFRLHIEKFSYDLREETADLYEQWKAGE